MNVPPPPPPRSPVPNHLVWAVLVTVASLFVCCIVGTIPGIVAIVFASQVNGKLSQGDYAGAERAARTAKLWCWITTALCVVGLLWSVYFISTGGLEQYRLMMQQMRTGP
ncbi:interferon-induced transmembrane protein [Vulcaniibacterium tengchongense]|uniref:Interferon-induced transmembrane protein n=1 Tax=Vulcaniibacterium tengchongense TaxID=1273429 RepID=A0A3N4UYK4_9GAMM|nr:CD225/dispanin family protein [Vulcaniibacterium tengchongense]RPE75802.1 interferon-induced transmembrane protein [Vulcaniibacterium tengchongense]